jgi:hypothetical protein
MFPQLGSLQHANATLRTQLRAVRARQGEDVAAREEALHATVAQLERALGERDSVIASLRHGAEAEVRVLVREGLKPRDLVAELLELRCVVMCGCSGGRLRFWW